MPFDPTAQLPGICPTNIWHDNLKTHVPIYHVAHLNTMFYDNYSSIKLEKKYKCARMITIDFNKI